MNIDLRNGDCLEVLKTLEENSIDSIVTDPPYHLTSIVKRFGKEGSAPAKYGSDGAFSRASKGFMGKEWDGGDISFRTELWAECLRVLKPGGHLLSFGGSRTYHRMACAIEDAGFEIRDQIMWIYGSGFPKSLNIGKAIDAYFKTGKSNPKSINQSEMTKTDGKIVDVLQPNNGILGEKKLVTKNIGASLQSEDAQIYEGWGSSLKPAHEPIVVARKPISEKSIAANVLKWGTGGINIDASRIGKSGGTKKTGTEDCYESNGIYGNGLNGGVVESIEGLGRFPANIMFDEEAAKLLDEQSGPTSQGHWPKSKTTGFGEFGGGESSYEGIGSKDKNVNKQGASRFFYCAKVSKKERNEGLEIPNKHPTLKPISLMTYLIKLVTPVGGTTLDPFMGSGSTGKAAIREGFSFVGIEREKDYFEIAKARIEYEHNRKTD